MSVKFELSEEDGRRVRELLGEAFFIQAQRTRRRWRLLQAALGLTALTSAAALAWYGYHAL